MLHVCLLQEWMDEFHTWDHADYGGVERVNIPQNVVWTPDIVLYQK